MSYQYQYGMAQSVGTQVRPARHRQRVASQNKKRTHRYQWVMHLLIIVGLLFGVFQTARALTIGSYRLTGLAKSQNVVEKSYQQALEENTILKDKIRLYSSPAGIEELARNSLGMVGNNEILVRIR